MEDRLIIEVLERLSRIEHRLDALEERLRHHEEEKANLDKKRRELTPALVRVLSAIDENQGVGYIKAIADRLDIPRNKASEYLNRLADMGFLYKRVNPDPRIKARYIYEIRRENIDEKLRELMEVVKNERWRLR